jgi:hypothetical protein
MAAQRFPVEAGHVLMFARALGDTSGAYSDANFADTGLVGLAAPPTFPQAAAQFDPDYPLRPHPRRVWMGSPASSGRVDHEPDTHDRRADDRSQTAKVLHAEQRFEFTRPLRVGDILVAEQRAGRSWEKVGRKGGRLKFSEIITEFRDRTGELVVTATSVAVRTHDAATTPEMAGGR